MKTYTTKVCQYQKYQKTTTARASGVLYEHWSKTCTREDCKCVNDIYNNSMSEQIQGNKCFILVNNKWETHSSMYEASKRLKEPLKKFVGRINSRYDYTAVKGDDLAKQQRIKERRKSVV